MRRWLLLLVLPVALAAAGLVAGYLYLSSRDQAEIRAELEQGLARALGRPVSIEGELEFRLRPLPAATVSGLRVANAPWARADDLLTVVRVDLVPSLPALLRGRIVIHRLELEGVRLWLQNGPDGQPNWRLPPRAETADPDATPMRIQAIDARDVQLDYYNAVGGVTRTISLDRVEVRGQRRTDPLELQIEGEVQGLPLNGSGTLDSLAKLSSHERAGFSADLRLGESRLVVEGSATDPDFRDYSGFETRIDVAGRRAVLLLDWTDLPIPEMRRFALGGRLVGDGPRLALRELTGEMEGDGYRIGVSGEADDLLRMAGVDFALDTSGTSIDNLVSAVELPWLKDGRFALRGRLVGTQPAFALEDLAGEFSEDYVELEAAGRIGDLRAGREMSLDARVASRQVGRLRDLWQLLLPELDEAELRGTIRGEWSAPTVDGLTGRLREGSVEARVSGHIADLVHLSGIDVAFDGDGTDLADLGSLFELEFPTSDGLTAAGRLTGSRQALDLRFDRARITRRDLVLEGRGTMRDLVEAPRLDLNLTLTGRDVREGGELIGVELFDTRRFTVSGRLRGPIATPDLDAISGRFVNAHSTLDVEGRLPDVFSGNRIDLRPIFRGSDLARLGQIIGQTWPETESYTLRAHARGSWVRPSLTDIDVRLTGPTSSLTARGRAGDLLGGRDFELSVQARARSVTEFLPFGGRLWDRLGAVAGNFNVSGEINDFVMEIGELTAGTSRLAGRFNLRFDDDDTLSYLHGRLENSVLDMSAWILPGDEAAGANRETRSPDERPLFPPEPLPLDWFKGLEMDVDLAGNSLVVGNSIVEVATGELVVRNDRLFIDPFDVDYRGSDIAGGFSLDGAAVPALELRAEARAFDLGDLLSRSGLAPDARGRVDVRVNLSAQGASAQEMAGSAGGRISLLMVGGSLGQVDVQLRLTQILAGLVRREQRDLIISCAMMDMPIAAGIGTLNVFVIDTQDMLMRGEGKFDFGQETMDVLLLPRPKRGRALAHNANVRVRGPLRSATHSIDASDTATTMAGHIGRFALLGPAGLFVSRSTFDRAQEDCASTLAEVAREP